MTCDQVKEQLPDYLIGGLDENTKSAVEAHLSACIGCKETAAIWTRLGWLPEEEPSSGLRARFNAMVRAYGEGLAQATPGSHWRHGVSDWLEKRWPRRLAFQFALAMVFLIVGLVAGRLLTTPGPGSIEMAQLREEIHAMRQLVALSLLQQSSASERLRGVNWSYRVGRPNRDVLSALLQTLRYDTSVDVRLAAVDSLRQFSNDAMVRQGLIEALGRQESPLVQIALIDVLVDIRERRSMEVLRQLSQDKKLNEAVRQRADWGLGQLR